MIGSGPEAFADAADALLTWRMHLRAGLRVAASSALAEPGAVVLLSAGAGPVSVRAPCRVIYAVNSRTARALRAQLVELAAERDALRAQLEGDLPTATRWLQRKVWRQAAALDVLNRRVVTQRFVLRTLDELGRSLTAAEYLAARARTADPQLRARIEAPPAA